MNIIKSAFYMNIPRILLAIIIFFASANTYCQNNPEGNEDNKDYLLIRPGIISISDSLLKAGNIFKDSLIVSLKTKSFTIAKKYVLSADSISIHLKDSLSIPRKDSLRLVKLFLQENISKFSQSIPLKLTEIHKSYSEKVNSIKTITFDDIKDASDTLGTINEEFRDDVANSAEEWFDSFKDTVDNAVDSLCNYSEILLDNQNDENDRIDSLWDYYYSYGLFFKAGYTSDMQYHGYKGGSVQRAYFPGLYYSHPNGIGLLLNTYNISGTIVPWDEIELGASYTHTFGDNFTTSLSYIHYTFNDTSEIAKQGLSGVVSLNLFYDFTFLSAGSSFEACFGTQTDFALILNLSKKLMFSKKDNHQIWLEPEFTGIYGTESLLNSRIVNAKNGKNKPVKKVKTTVSNVFSVLDYELSIPLNIETGRFIITPEYDFSIPFNQPPFTDSGSFGFFTLNIAFKIL